MTGYRGVVKLGASWNSVTVCNWGSGVTLQSSYTFTASDAGSHTFTPKFSYSITG